jgi:cytochrome c553
MKAMAGLALLAAALGPALFAEEAEGKRSYESRCSACHGGDGNGGERGPEITSRLPVRTEAELATLVREGLPGAGMPAFALPEAELQSLVAFLRTLRPREGETPVRARVGDLAGTGHRAPLRLDLAHGHLRPGPGHPLLAHRQPLPGLQRGRAKGRQPLLRLDPRPRRKDGPPPLVLPVHAPRPLGLGRPADPRARGRGVGRTAAAAPPARQPQRLLLRPRPDRRAAVPGEALREEAHLGEADRFRRASGLEPRPGAHTRGQRRLPRRGRGHELVLDVLSPRHRSLLRAGARVGHLPSDGHPTAAGTPAATRRLRPSAGGRSPGPSAGCPPPSPACQGGSA